jgi:hypothetical protein
MGKGRLSSVALRSARPHSLPGDVADDHLRTVDVAGEEAFETGRQEAACEADEVAAVVAFLASPRCATITGDAIVAGGGTPGAIFY